jgi:hypothetical protein
MFLTFNTARVSPLGKRPIHINVFDIVSVKTAIIEKEAVGAEIGLKSDVLVDTEDNEKRLSYIVIEESSEEVRELVNVTLNGIRNRKV